VRRKAKIGRGKTDDDLGERLAQDEPDVRIEVLSVDSLSSSHEDLERRRVLLSHLGDEEVHVLYIIRKR
jgi:hypothetical protein